MELIILNTNLEVIAILDTFESVIWTDRYCGYGDFEIYDKVTEDLFGILKEDYYICQKDSDHVMVIEDIDIKSNVDDGAHLVVTGRSIESIIDRRIIWVPTVLSGNLQSGIETLLNDNVISPSLIERKIPNFVFEASDDPSITSLTIDAQFTGDNLYDVIKNLCAANNIGFKITLSDTNQFVFKLYSGVDRSYDQFDNPYVIFSPTFENIVNSNYSKSKKGLKTITLVAGEGEGTARKTAIVGLGSGVSRREMYTDAKDLSQTVNDVPISDADYYAQLALKGIEDLVKNGTKELFDGEVDTTQMFKYGVDFFMGDVTQLVNEYGIKAKARVTEIIHSQSTSGIEVYPTFTII